MVTDIPSMRFHFTLILVSTIPATVIHHDLDYQKINEEEPKQK